MESFVGGCIGGFIVGLRGYIRNIAVCYSRGEVEV